MSAVPAQAVQALGRWFEPGGAAAYVKDVFHVEPDPWQCEAMDALLFDERHRVSIAACNGPGKTAVAAWSAFRVFHYAAIAAPNRSVIMRATAPTGDQLEEVLWTELRRWHEEMPDELKRDFRITSSKIEFTAVKNSFGTARTAREEKPEALQGVHNERGFCFFIVEEATGVADNVFETIGGSLTNPNTFVLMIMNPTRTGGYAYESHHKNKALWHTMTVDHTMSPRVTDTYVRSMANEYGVDSNVYRARVLGLWPNEESDQLISMDWVTTAQARETADDSPIVWGLDVATLGADRSALAKRQGSVLLEPVQTWRELEPDQLEDEIVDIWDATPDAERPVRICIDMIGVGAGVPGHLRKRGLPAMGVNVSESPSSRKTRFARKRDELWWRVREWFQTRQCSLPEDPVLADELVSIKFKELPGGGKVKIESKDEMKKRLARGRELGKSPDCAEALMLTFAYRPAESAERRPEAPVRPRYVRREGRRDRARRMSRVV